MAPHDEDFRKAASRLSRRIPLFAQFKDQLMAEDMELPDDENLVDSLQRESKLSSYQAVTIRLPPRLFKTLNDFCDETGIKRSILLRRIIQLGWEHGKAARAEAEEEES